jgi:hypothetical protein
MDVNEQLRQMATAKAPAAAQGMPKRGTYIEVDGEELFVTSSVQLGGKVIVHCLDAERQVRRVEL